MLRLRRRLENNPIFPKGKSPVFDPCGETSSP
jgi:hypothetical protein